MGVRLVEGGAFSTYALKEVGVGDELEVMTPAGRFTLEPAPGLYAAIVGGSGITPVLSIVSTLLAREPEARFCLIRSDRTAASTMFLEEAADLKDRYPERLQLVTVLSREEQQAGLPSGRLDRERLTGLLPALLPVDQVAGWFLCGPFGLVEGAEKALRELGVDRARIHEEIFHVDAGRSRRPPCRYPRTARHRPARRTRRYLAGPGRRVPAGNGAAQPPRRSLRLQGRGVRNVQGLPGLGRGAHGPELRAGGGGDGRRICTGLPVASADGESGAGLRPLRRDVIGGTLTVPRRPAPSLTVPHPPSVPIPFS